MSIYPLQSKEDWGSSYWKVIHQLSADFPNNPTRSDKIENRTLFDLIIKHLPCKECVAHAKEYVRANPPNLRSKKDFFDYTCSFHNEVNRKLGKPVVSCDTIFNPSSYSSSITDGNCTTCNVEKLQTVAVPDLSSDFETYKNISTQIFSDLCEKEGIPVPQISYAPCPGFPSTSCNDISNKQSPVIYINPFTASLRQIIHEFHHYKELVKNKNALSSEKDANDYAYEQIQQNFPHDKVAVVAQAVIKDDTPDPMSVEPILTRLKDAEPEQIPSMYGQSNDWQQRFPYYAQAQAQAEAAKQKQVQEKKAQEGLISYLDNIYTWPSRMVGITPQQMNLAHTPALIENALMTLVETNTTVLGSSMVSFVAGVALFLGGYFARNNLAFRDKLAVQHLSANFLWNTLKYTINPKTNKELKKSLQDMYVKVAAGDFKKITDMLVETPGMHTLKKAREKERLRPKMYVPHAAYARGMAAQDSGHTIRNIQNMAQRHFDEANSSMGPVVMPGGGTMLPAEIRAATRQIPVDDVQNGSGWGNVGPSIGTDFNRMGLDKDDSDISDIEDYEGGYQIMSGAADFNTPTGTYNAAGQQYMRSTDLEAIPMYGDDMTEDQLY